jgi:hypothetical protein
MPVRFYYYNRATMLERGLGESCMYFAAQVELAVACIRRYMDLRRLEVMGATSWLMKVHRIDSTSVAK